MTGLFVRATTVIWVGMVAGGVLASQPAEPPAGADAYRAVQAPSPDSTPALPDYPDDYYYQHAANYEWGMHNTLNPGFDMRMPEAWNICRGSGDVRVAVIDLGVQCNHPDFGGQEFRNVKFPDGYDFVDHLDPPYPNSNESHGTACAGIITAISDNDELGIASIGGGDGTIDGGIPVVPVRVASYDNRVDAIGWTGERVNTGIRVANMSWDIADGPSLRAAVSDAWHNGLAMVAAAGQAPLPPTDPVFPSCYHHAVVRVGGVYRTVKW